MAGGKRPGAGRKPGSKNKRTLELEQKAKDAAAKIQATFGNAFEGDAHAFLMAVYKNPDPDIPLAVKVDAAKAAIRYEKPALSSIEATGKDGAPLTPTEIAIRIVDAAND